MAFDETQTSKPQTAHDRAVEAERRRKIREYQRPFIEPIVHCLHCQHDMTPEEMGAPMYRATGRLCQGCRTELEQYLEPEEEGL